MNYAELEAAVEAYTENTFTAVDFANMTRLAEQKIYNSVQLPIMWKTATIPIVAGVDAVNAPSDFLNVLSFAVVDGTGTYNYLTNKDYSFMYEAFPTPTVTGTPKYYAISGPQGSSQLLTEFVIGPTPGTNANVVLTYSYYPTSIVTAGNTWLGDNFDSVLFNAVMVEAIRFMKGEDDLAAMYAEQYKQSLTLFKNLVDGKLNQDAYRGVQPRVKVI